MGPGTPLFSDRLERALRRAAHWHRGQERRGSGAPYIEHVVGVAMILDRLGFPEDVVVAALLHDAVEDTDATLADVRAEFGDAVADAVAHCSEVKLDDQGRKRPWIDRKTDHIAVLRNAPVEARAVALADKLHNLLSIRVDLAEGRPVWDSFHAERDRVLWYYRTCIDAYSVGDARLDALAVACREVLATIETAGENPGLGR